MSPAKKKPALVVRSIDGDIAVHRVELQSIGERYVDRVESGLMRNMDLDKFYVDDSEIEEARELENDE